VTVTEPDWSDEDRGLVLALLQEQAETCPSCGHPVSLCRDPSTAGRWTVMEDLCQPSRVAQAKQEEVFEQKRRGVQIATRLNR
jgi:hypothetical protein